MKKNPTLKCLGSVCFLNLILLFNLPGPLFSQMPEAGRSPGRLMEMDFPAPLGWASACEFEDLKLPERAKIYVVAAYGGAETGWQIDQSGHEATMINVAVNSPGNPVVLMLGAYEPNIWQIGWTEGTEIVAVLASGYHAQALNGLSPEVPVLVSSSTETGGPCPDFYSATAPGFIEVINNLSKKLFGRSPDKVAEAGKGLALVGSQLKPGQKLLTAKTPVKEDFQRPGTPLAGRLGIEEAVEKGLLRPATYKDREQWEAARSLLEKKSGQGGGILDNFLPAKNRPDKMPEDPNRIISRSYTIIDPEFMVPAGLYGGNSVSFYLPPGLPLPGGERGHCTIYIIEDGSICYSSTPDCGLKK